MNSGNKEKMGRNDGSILRLEKEIWKTENTET
jgi:hypothetical protein